MVLIRIDSEMCSMQISRSTGLEADSENPLALLKSLISLLNGDFALHPLTKRGYIHQAIIKELILLWLSRLRPLRALLPPEREPQRR